MEVQQALPESRLNIRLMSDLRNKERPNWNRNGTLVKKTTKKHYLPRHPYYYTSKELFDYPAVDDEGTPAANVKTYFGKHAADDARRASSAPHQVKKEEPKKALYSPKPPSQDERRKSSNEVKEKKTSSPRIQSSNLNRPKTTSSSVSYKNVFPESVAWSVTPLPGLRVLQNKDYYRKKAMDMKNTDIFYIDSGLIPKYMGYVPGFKFRYGGTFGTMTYNAKEIGVGTSLTWGGAVSLF